MSPELEEFLTRLKAHGEENDRTATRRADKMLNITADTGLFLWMVLRASRPKRLLEIGTSNGYSTIWWADAMVEAEQVLTTLEANPDKARQACANFAEAGFSDRIQLWLGDAGEYLRNAPNSAVDWLFLDSERTEYAGWWPDIMRVTAPGGLIVVDNAIDKASELTAFTAIVDRTPGMRRVLVPIGNGELFIHKDDRNSG